MPPAAAAAAAPAAAASPAFRSSIGCTPGGLGGQDAFVRWCAAERVTFPSSRLGELPGTGRGLIATRKIMMGEVVVEVPDSAVVRGEGKGVVCQGVGGGKGEGGAAQKPCRGGDSVGGGEGAQPLLGRMPDAHVAAGAAAVPVWAHAHGMACPIRAWSQRAYPCKRPDVTPPMAV